MTFQYNTIIVLLGVGMLGAGAGLIGSFAVLRRRALLGDALAHAAFPGLCLGFLILGERNLLVMLLGALATGFLGIATISFVCHWTRVRQDAAIGIVLSVFFGAGIVLSRLIQNMPSLAGSKGGLDSYILGKTAGITRPDVVLIAGGAVACVALVLLLFKEFFLVSFDYEFGRVQGWPVRWIDLALTGLIAVVVVIGLPAVGVVMMAALLIIPGAAARFWTDRLSFLVILASAIGIGMGLIGTLLSASYDKMPAGPVITLVGTGMFTVSALFAPRRGLLARSLATHQDRWQADYAKLLQVLYEFGVSGSKPGFEELSRAKSWSPSRLQKLLNAAMNGKDVQFEAAEYTLSPLGQLKAVEMVRQQRLLQRLVTDYPEMVSLARPTTGEPVESYLPSDVVSDLTHKLQAAGQWPKLPPEAATALKEGVR